MTNILERIIFDNMEWTDWINVVQFLHFIGKMGFHGDFNWQKSYQFLVNVDTFNKSTVTEFVSI